MNWPKRPVSDLCLLAVDCVNKTAPVVEDETPYRMIRTTNVKGGFVDVDDVRYVSETTFETWTRRSRPQFGDVILTREAPVGEVGRFTSSLDTVFLGQRLFHYRPDPQQLDWNYLAYVLQSHDVQGRLRGMGFGATVEHIKVGDAENLLIPVPPLDVQKRIGGTLAAYDDLIENNRRRMALLEDAARQLYREWFIRLGFPGHEHTRIAKGVPDGWVAGVLGDACNDARDAVAPDQLEPDTPYIGLEHMPRRSIALAEWGRVDEVTSTKLQFRQGEILFGKIRPYFHKVGLALVDGVASSDAIVIRPRSPDLACLVLCCVSSDPFIAATSQGMKEGSKMPRADWKQMKQYPLPVPPAGLLADFNSVVEPLLAQIRTLALHTRTLKVARDLLLPRLIRGDIAV